MCVGEMGDEAAGIHIGMEVGGITDFFGLNCFILTSCGVLRLRLIYTPIPTTNHTLRTYTQIRDNRCQKEQESEILLHAPIYYSN